MEALFILIPISLITVLFAVLVFINMSNSGQFDDDEGPAWSILMDDDKTSPEQPAKQAKD